MRPSAILFFNGDFDGAQFDTSTKWDTDPTGMLTNADETWPTMKSD